LPWQSVEVRIVRGQLMEELARLAAKHQTELMAEARQRVLESTKADRHAKSDALHRARAVVAGSRGGEEEDGPTSTRGCLPAAEARLAAAKRGYQELLVQLAPRIAALGVAAHSPVQAIAGLQESLQAKVSTEARRLRDEYLHTHVIQQSGTVLAAGMGADRLCWRVENKRDAGIRFRGPTVLYNGRPLPEAVASQIWGLPSQDASLHIPNDKGANEDVLPPGSQFETCFYARNALLSPETIATYGLSADSPTRTGEWRVQWQDVLVVSASAQAGPLAVAFPDRLGQLESESQEIHLIEALRDSTAARAVAEAETALLACHRAVELGRANQDGDRIIQAIERGGDEFALRVRVRPLLRRLAQDSDRLSKWIAEASSVVESRTVARQEQVLGEKYRLLDLEAGQYTLLAKPIVDTAKPKLWLIPLDVQGRMTQDLVAAQARDATLRDTLKNILLEAR
jgi:hypothetical protein